MKKITRSLFLLAAASLFLASCSQLANMTITKRHFNSGYYVDMGNAKHKTEAIAQQTKAPAAEITPVAQTANTNKTAEPVKTPATAVATAAPGKKKDISRGLMASALKHDASGNVKPTLVPNTLQELKSMKALSKRIALESKGNNNNHSLLWTIIVIILIIWLVSYLMGGWGLGGLLNLLLLIALILIILALLGV